MGISKKTKAFIGAGFAAVGASAGYLFSSLASKRGNTTQASLEKLKEKINELAKGDDSKFFDFFKKATNVKGATRLNLIIAQGDVELIKITLEKLYEKKASIELRKILASIDNNAVSPLQLILDTENIELINQYLTILADGKLFPEGCLQLQNLMRSRDDKTGMSALQKIINLNDINLVKKFVTVLRRSEESEILSIKHRTSAVSFTEREKPEVIAKLAESEAELQWGLIGENVKEALELKKETFIPKEIARQKDLLNKNTLEEIGALYSIYLARKFYGQNIQKLEGSNDQEQKQVLSNNPDRSANIALHEISEYQRDNHPSRPEIAVILKQTKDNLEDHYKNVTGEKPPGDNSLVSLNISNKAMFGGITIFVVFIVIIMLDFHGEFDLVFEDAPDNSDPEKSNKPLTTSYDSLSASTLEAVMAEEALLPEVAPKLM